MRETFIAPAKDVVTVAKHAARAACVAAAIPAVLASIPVHTAQAGGMYEMVSRDFKVGIDQAKMLRIEGAAAIVAVGNPSIADAILQGPDMLLLIGRTYGATNVLVFDHDGNETASLIVNVVDAAPRLLTLHRGNAQASYNCAPHCQPVLRIGDDETISERITTQSGNKMGLATEGAEATAQGSSEE